MSTSIPLPSHTPSPDAQKLCHFDRVGEGIVCRNCGFRVASWAADRLPYAVCGNSTQTTQPIADGPGTELKKLLGKIGIKASPTCACNARAAEMDRQESADPGWCQRNIDTIVGWLREEATKRGLPFFDAAGRLLIKRAISNARRASRDEKRQ